MSEKISPQNNREDLMKYWDKIRERLKWDQSDTATLMFESLLDSLEGAWLPIDPANLPPARPEGYWLGWESRIGWHKFHSEEWPKLNYSEPTHYHTGPGAPKEEA